ncbi:adaptin N terminal region-domain-containing protein [Rhizophagus diaphanus]|nr:adaptin N terminal region-domain-containing protein [Rhizophagus diaphanus] [Rhizophagus sp. MUCL 43196]
MLGYDMSWASFHVVEVMSSAKFLQKRIGYLAATQSFRQDTDVLMLTTNLLKKDLASGNHLEVGVALNGLAHIVTPDLARDLCQDLVSMLNHSRPYVRKKVVLVLYKLFLKFPEALRLSFPRLKEKLDDPDPSVACAVVNVICELARKNPKNYLSLAPQLFSILNTSTNNWMLIKIIKLFGALTPLEPRLAKKLLPPITQHIQTTHAMSLLYECIHTVITGGMLNLGGNSDSLAAMCVNKLRIFLEDTDQNLKYVGLLALAKILPTHPKLVSEHKDIILKCIDDPDISIRLRALDLVVGMVNKKNCTDIVKRLMSHLLPSSNSDPTTSYPPPSTLLEPAYRSDIINRVIYICSQNSYSNITNFEWYIAVLVDLTYVSGVKVGEILTQQIMDVGVRVKSVRQYCVKTMQRLISDANLLENCKLPDSNAEVLYAAAWISGEYCSYLEKPIETIEFLVQPGVTKLSHNVQAVYVHAVLKIYAYWANSLVYNWDDDAKQELIQITTKLKDKIGMFSSCTDLEVQERAYNTREIFSIIHQNLINEENDLKENDYSSQKAPAIITELSPLFFFFELNPVAPKAQKKVPVPEGLDLDAWINEPLPESENNESEEEEESYGYGYGQTFGGSGDLIFSDGNGATVGRRRRRKNGRKNGYESEDNEEIREKRRNERRERIKNDPYYINVDDKSPLKRSRSDGLSSRKTEEIDVDSIPVVRLTMDDFDFKSKRYSGKSRKSKGSKKENRRSPSPPSIPPVIYTDVGEMPENATLSDDEKDSKSNNIRQSTWNMSEKNKGILDLDYSGVSSVDLSTPLREDEHFPQMAIYLSPEEVRRREEERSSKLLEERRAKMAEEARFNKNKSEKPKSKSGSSKTTTKKSFKSISKTKEEEPNKKKKVSKKKNTEETNPKKKSKKTSLKKSKKKLVSEQEISETSENIQNMSESNGIKRTTAKTLLDTDDLYISYILHLGTTTEITNEPPTLIADFTIRSKVSNKSLTELSFTFESTSDIQFDNALLEVGELQSEEQKEMAIEFRVLGIVGVGLSVTGNLAYSTQSSDEEELTNHNIPIKLGLPLSIFMLNIPKITPEQFKTTVSQTSSFPFSATTLIQLNPNDRTFEQMFQDESIRLTTIATGTHVVEIVSSAITVYGKSVQGYQVAGLAKFFIDESGNDNAKFNIKVELKCTDQAFLDGLIREIDNMFNETI